MTIFAQRRAELARKLGSGVAVIPAARHAVRNADTEYEYRQDSDLYYLTGLNEPDAVLVIAPAAKDAKVVLFLRPRSREQEIWTGRRLGVEGALEELGVDAAFPIEEIDDKLGELLVGADTLHYRVALDEAYDRMVFAALRTAKYHVRRGGVAPTTIVEPGAIVHEMRLRKGPEELAIMRRAAAITRFGHEAGMRITRPGLFEYELEAEIEHQYMLHGAQGLAYPSIVGGGDNATILHYNTNRDVLRDGSLVLIDSGAEVDLYASDVTRTWPVSGRFTAEQKALYEIVLNAQRAGIDQVRAGRSYNAYHEAAVRILAEGLIDVGLISGTVDSAIESGDYKAFYPHRTGHWIGLDVHDVGRYTESDGAYRVLEPGMIVTVEPGLYVQRDLECDDRWKGIGIRIEDDIVCTDGEPENLTAAIPKEISDIEALVGSGQLVGVR